MSTYLEFLHDHWVGDAAGSSKPAKEVNVPKFPSMGEDEEDQLDPYSSKTAYRAALRSGWRPSGSATDKKDRQVHFGGNEYGPSPFTTERDKKKKDGNPLQPNMVPYVKGDPTVHPHNFSNPYGDEKDGGVAGWRIDPKTGQKHWSAGDKAISEKEFRKRVNAFAR